MLVCGGTADVLDEACAAALPVLVFPPLRFDDVASSLGTMSIKKSNMSDLLSADAISERCRVRLLFSSACIQARIVNSVMKMSHPLANNIGASADIIFTSGSAFMTFFIRARGS